jgi:hypothetical protein
MTILLPMLQGGLGNILFQVFGVIGISESLKINPKINITFWKPATQHSSLNYFDTLLVKLKKYHRNVQPKRIINEKNLEKLTFSNLKSDDVIVLKAYLQHYTYFWNLRDKLLSYLSFNACVQTKYPRLSESAFIHVRGGDYINHPIHQIELTNYYQKALDHIRAPHYYIFTNDEKYFNTLKYLQNVPHTIVRENEIDSLYLMTQCKRGAICANSSFSWWGAFLNRDRIICMPSKWFNNPKLITEGLYFPGVTILEV